MRYIVMHRDTGMYLKHTGRSRPKLPPQPRRTTRDMLISNWAQEQWDKQWSESIQEARVYPTKRSAMSSITYLKHYAPLTLIEVHIHPTGLEEQL